MGNRILKESIKISQEINALSLFEEVAFYRLIVTVDDYGVYPMNYDMLGHILFPGKNRITGKMMKNAIEHMESLNLVYCYHVEGRGDFLKLVSWERHQRLRKSRHKYPIPVTEDDSLEARADQQWSEQDMERPVVKLPLIDGTTYAVTRKEAAEYEHCYPAVNVYQELRNMVAWCLSNPEKQKTRGTIGKFINGWLQRHQNENGMQRPLLYNMEEETEIAGRIREPEFEENDEIPYESEAGLGIE